MNKYEERLLEQAKINARDAHKGQKRHTGEDYITHPEAVAKMVAERPVPVEYQIVAWLHDVVEDTDLTLEVLHEYYPPKIVQAIDAITKRDGEEYTDYLDRVYHNEMALEVKICDIKHNLSTLDLDDPEWKKVNTHKKDKYLVSLEYFTWRRRSDCNAAKAYS